MAIVKWDPLREMMSIQREMNRLFDDVAVSSNGNGNQMNGQMNGGRSMGMLPLAEMDNQDDKIHLKVEVPGMSADDLDIRVMKEAVMISGERKTESTSDSNGQKRSEFRYGSFSRTIPLPEPVDNSSVEAEYKDGILTLEMPKVEDNSNKAVKVSLNSASKPSAQQLDASSGQQNASPEDSQQQSS